MTALATKRMREQGTMKNRLWTLKSGEVAFQGGIACLELSSNKVVIGDNETGSVFLGIFKESKDASAADALVNIDLLREVNVEWLANDTTAPVTNILRPCYILDDQTVTADPEGNSIAGLVWAVDAIKGVAVERVSSIDDKIMQVGGTLSYTSNNAAPTSIVSGAVYDVPTTAANSTITLPAAVSDGTWAIFVADGSKNGHTVQYIDATGTTAITTALTASKRHMVRVQKLNDKWFAQAYVSP
jgi:hypothetical protein